MKFPFIALAALALCVRPAAAGAAVDACKAIGFADASKAVGQNVISTERSRMIPTSCTYKAGLFRSLVFTIESFSSPAEARSEYHATITNPATQAAPSAKLSGIGDDAQRLGTMIYVLKHESIYAFSLLSLDNNGAGAIRVIALARSVVPKL